MTDTTSEALNDLTIPAPISAPFVEQLARRSEALVIPLGAIVVGLVIFCCFLLALGKSPLDFLGLMVKGGFGTWFSVQNSLQRAAPLLLTALCVALPARLGLVVIGGEGAVVLGGVAGAAVALPLLGAPPVIVQLAMGLAGIMAGAAWIGFAGWLRARRGINETISSLL